MLFSYKERCVYMTFIIFKRKFKNEYKKAINKKIAFPEKEVICPKCGKSLLYSPIGFIAEVKCPTKKCIMGNSKGIYQYQ